MKVIWKEVETKEDFYESFGKEQGFVLSPVKFLESPPKSCRKKPKNVLLKFYRAGMVIWVMSVVLRVYVFISLFFL